MDANVPDAPDALYLAKPRFTTWLLCVLLQNAVRCVATAGQYLVSGGADDTIHMYDLKVSSPGLVVPSESDVHHIHTRV